MFIINKMKWFACTIVLNGAEWLWYSIKSIYDFIRDSGGKMVIIEGSTKYATNVAKDGASTDDTQKIIEGFIRDSDPKFFIYKRLGKVEDKRVLRNAYLDEIKKLPKEEHPDMILIVDADELYKKADLQRLDKFLEKHQDVWYIFNNQHFFWRDFRHEMINKEWELRERIALKRRRDKLFYDMLGREMRQGEFHERIYKWDVGLSHNHSHATVANGKGRELYIDKFYENNRLCYPGCPRYHYGYLTTTQKMRERFMYYEVRDHNLTLEKAKQLDIWNDNYGYYLVTGMPWNTLSMVINFVGSHPEIVKLHPYYKKGICPMAEEANNLFRGGISKNV